MASSARRDSLPQQPRVIAKASPRLSSVHVPGLAPSAGLRRISNGTPAKAKCRPASAAVAAAAEAARGHPEKAHTQSEGPRVATREKWRQVLAQSNTEMLRELAAQATLAATDPSRGRSMEQVAFDVADRMLDKVCAAQLFSPSIGEDRAEEEEEAANSNPPKAMLDDLQAVPWNIWSGEYCGEEPAVCKEVQQPTRSNASSDLASPPDLASSATTNGQVVATVSSLTRPPIHRDFLEPSERTSERKHSEEFRQRRTASLFDGHLIERRLSDTNVSEDGGLTTRHHLPDCGAVMNSGLQLLTTTQEQTYMRWRSRPKTVLFCAKLGDPEVIRRLREMCVWVDSQGCTVLVEPKLFNEIRAENEDQSCIGLSSSGNLVQHSFNGVSQNPASPSRVRRSGDAVPDKWGWGSNAEFAPGFVERIRTFNEQDKLEGAVDLVICIGGDGSLCWAASLFHRAMPPVIAFAGGSLGFLTPFAMDDWMHILPPVLGAKCTAMLNAKVACRMRFQYKVVRHGEDPEDIPPRPEQALNEVLVRRGRSGNLCKLEVWVGKTKATMVQGDGLIIATPTGSTAYSLAAGGSMMHPAVPGILLTPVCPHSLSFRPVVLPDSAVVTVRMPLNARNNSVSVAIDGKDKVELGRGDSIELAVSQFPVPTVCKNSVTDDWFLSVNEALQWNLRLEQKGSLAQPSTAQQG